MVDEYLSNQTGRNGQLRKSLRNYLTENYAEYWGDVPAALRESIVVDVIAAMIRQRCRNDPDPVQCAEWSIEPVLNEILKKWGIYHDDCINSLAALRERLQKQGASPGKRIRSVIAAGPEIPGVMTCPMRVGREEMMQNPLSGSASEPYGVFLAGDEMFVGQESRLWEMPTCSLAGWGVDCAKTVGDVAPLRMLRGPFESSEEATAAYCASIVPGSVYYPPLVVGHKATFAFDGREHWISNAPGCPD